MKIDYSKISNVEVDGIDTSDYPDFSDAFISYAEYDGEEMSEEMLEELNNDSSYVYEKVQDRIF